MASKPILTNTYIPKKQKREVLLVRTRYDDIFL